MDDNDTALTANMPATLVHWFAGSPRPAEALPRPSGGHGVAAEASENVETVTVADLDLSDLAWAKAQGTVRNLRDRRFDLYKTVWTDGG